VAGNIGAKEIQEAAGELERSIHRGREEEIDQALESVITKLHSLLRGLEASGIVVEAEEAESVPVVDIAQSRQETADRHPGGFDRSEVERVFRELHGHIVNNSIDAGDTLEKLIELLGGKVRSKNLNVVIKAIDGYDFDTALETLTSLARELDVNLV
jgi:hypothetical protein